MVFVAKGRTQHDRRACRAGRDKRTLSISPVVAAELKKRGIPLEGKLYTVDGVKDAILRYVKEGGR